MRLRLLLSFGIIILVALGSVLVAASVTAEQEVQVFLGRGALAGVETLVTDLEEYYQTEESWDGVLEVFVSKEANAALTSSEGLEQGQDAGAGQDVGEGQGAGSGQDAGAGHGVGEGQGTGEGQSAGEGSGGEESSGMGPGHGSTQSGGDEAVTESATELVPEVTPGVVNEGEPAAESATDPKKESLPHGSTASEIGLGYLGRPGHRLTDADGVIVYSPEESELGLSLSEVELEEAITIDKGGTTVGYLLPEGGNPQLPTNFEAQLVERIQHAATVGALISGGIAIILALILAQMVLKPVKVLTQAADRLSDGDLSQRVRIKGKNELSNLGDTFNQMAASLQDAAEQRRAMTADIAHELRIPLAVQQANLEALQDGVYPLTQANIKPIIEQNHLLARLVGDLRTLALADSGELSLNRRPVDLRVLCLAIIARFEAAFVSSGIKVLQDVEVGLGMVNVDPERIEQILHNLLQNAQRYTAKNASIFINLYRDGQMAVLSVRDTGPGIPEEALGLIFKRFYRVDKGRERTNGGTGLGLAIARQLAEAHGGSLGAANHPEGGAVFTLRLPLDG
ncbi:MAG: ATP-binding protein [Chloroflexota bacterium]